MKMSTLLDPEFSFQELSWVQHMNIIFLSEMYLTYNIVQI